MGNRLERLSGARNFDGKDWLKNVGTDDRCMLEQSLLYFQRFLYTGSLCQCETGFIPEYVSS